MSGDLYPGDLVARRVLRALNCAVMGWILFSSALYVKRKNAKDRKRLELVTIGCMLMSFVCEWARRLCRWPGTDTSGPRLPGVFLVTINIVLLPFRGTPATDFECNLFERGGNITNFVMYAGMVYFFYLRTETIRKNIMSTNFIKTPLFTWLCTSLAYAIIVGFFATCAYIESFPLRAEECFFGVPPFVGTLVISLLAASAFTFLIIFTYILLKETLMSEALRRKAITCWVTTLLAFITESMCFLVLNHYFADELWNMVLHMDMVIILIWNFQLLSTRNATNRKWCRRGTWFF